MCFIKKLLTIFSVVSIIFCAAACERQDGRSSSVLQVSENTASVFSENENSSKSIGIYGEDINASDNEDDKVQRPVENISSEKENNNPTASKKPTTTTSSKKTETTKPGSSTTTSSEITQQASSQPIQGATSNKKLVPLSEDEYYGWQMLKKSGTEAERKAYKLFVSKIENFETTITFNFQITRDEVTNAYNMYHSDYPQHFWRGTSYVINYSGNSVRKLVLENNAYGSNVSKIKSDKLKIETAANKILSKLNGGMSDFEKEVIIHNEIIKMTKYQDGTNSHKLTGVFIDGRAVCEGYSYAFQYLMRCAGIQCITVIGRFNNDNHMWNMAKIDGNYYFIDVTADDPIMSSGGQIITFDYFNVSSKQLNVTHKLGENYYSLPTANSVACEFFNKNSLVLNNLTVKNVANIFAFSVNNGYDRAYMRLDGVSKAKFVEFISSNLNNIIKETNNILGKSIVKPMSNISFGGNDNRNTVHLKINY